MKKHKLLNPAINLQEIHRTKEHVKQVECGKTLQVKLHMFLNKNYKKKINMEERS